MSERPPSPPCDNAEAPARVVLDKLSLLNKEGTECMLTVIALAIREAIEEDRQRPRVIRPKARETAKVLMASCCAPSRSEAETSIAIAMWH